MWTKARSHGVSWMLEYLADRLDLLNRLYEHEEKLRIDSGTERRSAG